MIGPQGHMGRTCPPNDNDRVRLLIAFIWFRGSTPQLHVFRAVVASHDPEGALPIAAPLQTLQSA